MTLRKLPATLALGLVAALAAHAGLFRDGHAMGGAYAGLLLNMACLAAAGLFAILATLLISRVGFAADGSVLASRVEGRLPGALALFVATSFWFVLGESLEPQHAAPSLLLTILALALFACVVWMATRAVVRWVADVVFAIARALYAAREVVRPRVFQPLAIARLAPSLRRRFARPPPSILTIALNY